MRAKHLQRVSAAHVILTVTALVVVYFLVTGSFSFVRSQQLQQQQGRLEADVQQFQQRFQRLQALQEYLNSDEYIEAVARQQLGLVRQGEIGLVVISTVPSPTPIAGQGSAAEPELWWDILIR